MLIDSTYFVGEILLPNLTGSVPENQANVNEVTRFIAKYEPEYLEAVLGAELYEAFVTGLAVDPGPIEQKWIGLRAKLIDSANKVSQVADYVYSCIVNYRMTATTGLGEVESTADNSNIALNTDKMIQAYNNSVRKGRTIREWLVENAITYPEYEDSEFTLSTVNIFGI
jgi:hypothetical protein